tara:strand:- start:318 stop:533 length:216 start_codon:yes stop_codon:yes gene_type:complete
LPQSDYINKNKNVEFVLVAIPTELVDDIDRLRDAVITYMPGYDKKDFEYLKKFLDWVENIEELQCIKDSGK